jgi:hypothetical protein
MNAKALYELVKDLPREAWPSCVTGWIRGIYVEVRTSETGDKPHAVSSHMFADDAVLLFEASMMRAVEGHGDVESCHAGDHHIIRVRDGDYGAYVAYAGKTRIEALAAAVKAVNA